MTTFIYYAEIIAWYWLAFCLIAVGLGLAIFMISLIHDQPEKQMFEGRK